MLGGQRRAAGRGTRVVARLGSLTWAWVFAGVFGGLALRGEAQSDVGRSYLLVILTGFFLTAIARLGAVGAVWSQRRLAALVLATAMLAWAAGSAVLTASGLANVHTSFPAPGEWLFLIFYLAVAGYVFLDADRPPSTALSAWLDAAVVTGGVACLAGALLLVPMTATFGPKGLPLMLALMYPLLDLMLALVVVAQAVLRARRWDPSTLLLAVGFVLLAVADSSIVLNLSSGGYDFTLLLDVTYGLAFALVATSACRVPRVGSLPSAAGTGSKILLSAVSVALLSLVLRPDGALGWYVTILAVATLLAAGARMALALREAHGAAEAQQLSLTDDLTGLPNRRAVLAQIDAAIKADRVLALMLIDLDGFKDVNDTFGHVSGDAVLRLSGQRMRAALPRHVQVGRLGGDEFAILVEQDDPVQLLETANALRAVLSKPTMVEDLELAVGASIGITVRERGDRVSPDLLRRADVAMYQAKISRAGALLYDHGSDGSSRKRLRLAEELRRALQGDELTVHYQPQVEAATQRVLGVEALVRWQHPQHGLVLPAIFLPVARQTGLMLAISEIVLQQLVDDARRWEASGLSLRLSMNVAPPELLGGLFLPRLFDVVQASGLAPDTFILEVTEDSFLADPQRARQILDDVRAVGVQLSIDDYGTGFSSLAYVRDLPVQELKMDRSFVSTICRDRRSRMIVASTNQMAHALGMRLVAEGVEDAATAAELVAIGVDSMQGFHLARPMPASEVEPWVRRWSAGRLGDYASLPLRPGVA
ncbi:MAG TPA: EAL domain-containing protein [Actinomycetes bacterium]